MIWKAVFLNALLQVAGLLVFVAVGATLPYDWLKAGIELLFVASSLLIIFISFPNYNWKKSLAFSLMAALTCVIVLNAIGFSFARGLVKDVTLFSGYHFYVASKVFCVAFVFYILCCTCILIKKWMNNKPGRMPRRGRVCFAKDRPIDWFSRFG